MRLEGLSQFQPEDLVGGQVVRNPLVKVHIFGEQVRCSIRPQLFQVHGGAGISDATPLAMMYGWHRAMRIFDGPDEVHLGSLARAELGAEPLFELPPLTVG